MLYIKFRYYLNYILDFKCHGMTIALQLKVIAVLQNEQYTHPQTFL